MAEAKRFNVRVSITPFPQKVPAILACGYGFMMGRSSVIIVSAEDADLLEAEANRQVKNARSGKLETKARFSFTRIEDTDKPVNEKLPNRRGVANVPPIEIPHEKQNELLLANLTAQQEHNKLLVSYLEKLSARK